jgi:ribose transport system substrate-binding protein
MDITSQTQRIISTFTILLLAAILSISGCSKKNDDAPQKSQTAEQEFVLVPLAADATDEVQPLEGLGPNGEKPVGVDALTGLITDEDAKKLREGNYTAVACFHFLANDWSQLQVKGIKDTLKKYNVKLLAVTDGQLKIDKQIADYESAIQLKPNLIITIPLDRDAAAPILRKAADNKIVLSFIDTIPTGFKHPKDYAGLGTADNYANGRVSAEILAKHLGEKGKVAMLNYKYSMFHTEQRSQAARETLKKYPGIQIIEEQSVENPEEAANKTESMLIAHPDLDGIWAVWDGAGTAAAGAIKNMGRKTVVTTVDLSRDSAYSIASGGLLLGTGTQHPYDQGVAETLIGLAAVLGKPTPPYVLVPGEKVTRKSMERSWKRVFKTELPDELKNALKE